MLTGCCLFDQEILGLFNLGSDCWPSIPKLVDTLDENEIRRMTVQVHAIRNVKRLRKLRFREGRMTAGRLSLSFSALVIEAMGISQQFREQKEIKPNRYRSYFIA